MHRPWLAMFDRSAAPSSRLPRRPAVLASFALLALFVSVGARAQVVRPDLWVTDFPVRAVAVSGNTLYIGGDFTLVGPATGCAAPIDASTGSVVGGFPKVLSDVSVVGEVRAVAPDGSGGWYLGGNFTHVGGVARANLAHVLADHSVAPWDPSADGTVLALVVSGATVFAGGDFDHVGGQARIGIAALDAVTGTVTAWDAASNGGVEALAVSGGTVYAGGSFHTIGGQPRSYIAAIDAGTGLATPWDPGANDFVSALALGPGVVYAGGSFTQIGGQPRGLAAAIDAATGLATAWNASGSAPDVVLAMAVSGSTVYVGGTFSTLGGQTRHNLAALDAGTGLATAWNPDPTHGGTNWFVDALAVNGSTVNTGGSFLTIGGQTRTNLAAVDASTGLATAWDPEANDFVEALAVSGGEVMAGGSFTSLGGVHRDGLAALDLTTGAPTAWAPANPGPARTVMCLAVVGSSVLVGGNFVSIGGQPRQFLAALDASSGLATAWDPAPDGSPQALLVNGNTVYVGGFFSSIGGQPRSRVGAVDATTGLATGWDPNLSSADFPFVNALGLSGSTLYVAGLFDHVGADARNSLAAIDVGTGLATSWDPNPTLPLGGQVHVLAVGGSAVYVGGDFTEIGGQTRNFLAAIDPATGLATPWNPDPDAPAQSLLATPVAIYASGQFLDIGGQPRRLAALDPATGLATIWDPKPDGGAIALAKSGTTLIAGGGFRSIGGLPQSCIAAMGDLSTPAQVSLVSTEAGPNRVRLTWFAAHISAAMVQRRTEDTDWISLHDVLADGTGELRFEDRDVSPGVRYGYRLGVRGEFLGETWVDVPRVAEFALAGQRPLPSATGLLVTFSLPDATPTRLEVFDVAGRVVVSREVGALGAGNHELDMAQGRVLPSGAYVIRLSRGSESRTARAIVVR